MSTTKDYWFDKIETQRNYKLAKLLGITADELEQIEYHIESDTSNDGFLYGYIVQFDNDNDPSIMNKIKGLTSNYVSLSPWELDGLDGLDDFEEEELNWELSYSKQYETFNRHLSSISEILSIQINGDAQFSLLIMLHAHIISAFEHFLATTFIYRVTNSDELTRKLVETDPQIKERKFTLNEIYVEHNKIKSTVAEYLKGIIYHNMAKVKPMYSAVLSFDFDNINWLYKAIQKRHDCVHRAGYDKDGNAISVSVDDINELMGNCQKLAQAVDDHVQQLVT